MRRLSMSALALFVFACGGPEPPSKQGESDTGPSDMSMIDGGISSTDASVGADEGTVGPDMGTMSEDAGVDAGPTNQPIGAACASDEQCASGECLQTLLWIGQDWELPGGYCSRSCNLNSDCEEDVQECFSLQRPGSGTVGGACLVTCDSNDECRDEYRCDGSRCVPKKPIGESDGAWMRRWFDVEQSLGVGVDADGNVYGMYYVNFGADLGNGRVLDSETHVVSYQPDGIYRWATPIADHLTMEVGARVALGGDDFGTRAILLTDMALDGELGQTVSFPTGFTSSEARGIDVGGSGEIAFGALVYGEIEVNGTDVPVSGQFGAGAVVLEPDGTTRWGVTFSADYTVAADVAIAEDGNVWLGGSSTVIDVDATTIAEAGDRDAILIELDSATGAAVGAVSFGGVGRDAVSQVASAPGGGVYVAGTFEGLADFGTESLDGGSRAIFLARVDADRSVTWARAFPATVDNLFLRQDPAGGVRLAGTYSNTLNIGGTEYTAASGTDFFILDVSADGTPGQFQSYTGAADDELTGYAVDPSGADVLSGLGGPRTFGAGTPRGDAAFLARLPREP